VNAVTRPATTGALVRRQIAQRLAERVASDTVQIESAREIIAQHDDASDTARILACDLRDSAWQSRTAYCSAFCDAIGVDAWYIAPVDQLQLVDYFTARTA
jgi:hypothetical protein